MSRYHSGAAQVDFSPESFTSWRKYETLHKGSTAHKDHYKKTSQVTRATHVRNRVCPRVELILKIIIILLIIFLGFIKSKPC